MSDGRPWTPVPLARGTHGAVVAPAPSRDRGRSRHPSRGRLGGGRCDRHERSPRRRRPEQLRDRRRRVLADLGRGRGSPARAERLGPVTRRGSTPRVSGRAGHATIPLRGPLSITVPGAVRSWGDAHERFGRLTRAAVLAPGDRARPGRASRPRRASARWSRRRRRSSATAIGPDAPFLRVYRPHGRPWRPGERVRLPALAATLEAIAGEGFDSFYEGEPGERQARGLAAAGSAITHDRPARHTSTWGEPIAIDYRGVRVTTHPPNSSGIVALELLAILAPFEPPPPSAFGPDGVHRPGLDPPRHRGGQAGHGRPRRAPDRPGLPRRPGRPADSTPATRPTLAGPDRPAIAPPARSPRRTRAGGGTIYLAAVDGDGNAVSLIESQLRGLRVGRRRPRHRRSSTRTGAATSASTTTIPTSSSRASGRSTRCSPGCCSVTAWRAVGRGRIDGRRCPAADPRPARLGAGRRRASTCGPRSPRRAGSSSRPLTSSRRSTVRLEPRFAPGVGRRRSRRSATRSSLTDAVRQRASATSTRSSSSMADRPPRTARSRPRPTRAATGLPGGLVTPSAPAPVRYSRRRWRAALTRRRHRSRRPIPAARSDP